MIENSSFPGARASLIHTLETFLFDMAMSIATQLIRTVLVFVTFFLFYLIIASEVSMYVDMF